MSAPHDRAEQLARWCIEQHGDSWERGFLPADAATVSEAYLELLSARQPSPSARDVALKCADKVDEIGDDWKRDGQDLKFYAAEYLARGLRTYADTLGNESAAAQPGSKQLAGRPGETSQPASAADHIAIQLHRIADELEEYASRLKEGK